MGRLNAGLAVCHNQSMDIPDTLHANATPSGDRLSADSEQPITKLLKATGGLLLAVVIIALLSALSRAQTPDSSGFSLFWPSAGLGLVLVARFKGWGVAATALGVGVWALLVMRWNLLASAWAAAASALGPWLTWQMLRQHFAHVTHPFSRSDTLLAFFRWQTLLGSVVSALVGSLGLWLTGHWPTVVFWPVVLLSYWMIETTGALLFAPVAWDVLNPTQKGGSPMFARKLMSVLRVEWVFVLLVMLLTSGVVALLVVGTTTNYALALLACLLPLLMVVSLRATPMLAHFLILVSALLVLVTLAFLQRYSAGVIDPPGLLLLALYLLAGTASLDVLLATSAEKRIALERLERLAFVDPQTQLLNEAGVARRLEEMTQLGTDQHRAGQVALISVSLSNAQQAASLAGLQALLELDQQMAAQLRSSAQDVQWGRVASGSFHGVWRGRRGTLQQVLSRVALLLVPIAIEEPVDVPGSQASALQKMRFRPQWDLAAVCSRVVDLSANPGQVMLATLVQAESRARQFRRVEIMVVDDALLVQLQQEALLVEQVRDAIQQRTLALYAQPIVANTDAAWAEWQQGGVAARKVEVLVRLPDASGRPMTPAEFMPAAMRAGLMPLLDLAVTEQTFAWLSAHPDVLERLEGCAINLSGPTVADANTVPFVQALLARYAVPPKVLIFEITESLAVTDTEVAAQTLRGLRSLGCRVAIDDFGTGVATFDYLKRFTVDFIKIDGTFIRALQEGVLDRTIVESMVNVAKCLGVRTVAEYVCSPELRALVTELGIHESQGYELGQPQPLAHWLLR